MERVLDTAALLHWPQTKLTGGVCATSQRQELKRLSEGRSLLVEAMDLRWQDVPADWLARATATARRRETYHVFLMSTSMFWRWPWDLMPIWSPMIIDCRTPIRMQEVHSRPWSMQASKAVWVWELRCTGCRDVTEVPEDVKRSKGQAASECRRCGSPMVVKRKRG